MKSQVQILLRPQFFSGKSVDFWAVGPSERRSSGVRRSVTVAATSETVHAPHAERPRASSRPLQTSRCVSWSAAWTRRPPAPASRDARRTGASRMDVSRSSTTSAPASSRCANCPLRPRRPRHGATACALARHPSRAGRARGRAGSTRERTRLVLLATPSRVAYGCGCAARGVMLPTRESNDARAPSTSAVGPISLKKYGAPGASTIAASIAQPSCLSGVVPPIPPPS